MKHIQLILICLVPMVFNAHAQQAKRFAIKSGYLKLELSGNTVGTKELWWDNYGDKTCELEKSNTTTKIFGMKSTEQKHMLTIVVKDQYWVVDYLDNTGTRGHAIGYQSGQDFAHSMTEAEQKQLEDDILSGFGGEKLGSEYLGAYSCDVFNVLGVKSWVYKGLTLKTEGKVLGIVSNDMYSVFKPGSSVPVSKFDPPKDIKFRNINDDAANFWGDMDDEEEEEEEEITIPLKYDYAKFKKVINAFSYPGFTCRGTNSVDGIYASTFTKGISKSLMIIAESIKNTEDGEYENYETLTVNGHKSYYGKMKDENGTALVVEYPKDEMVVVIAGVPSLEKSTLVEIARKLEF